MRRRIPQAAVFLALIAILAGCQISSPVVPPNKISLKPFLSLIVGETETLEPEVEPATASVEDLEWKSDDPSIATVDSSGKVTAIAAGDTVITVATQYGLKAECDVNVATVSVRDVTLDKTSLTLKESQMYTLVATVLPSYATNKNVTWSTSNASVVKLVKNDAGKEDGTIFANATGTADITVTTVDGNKSARCTVTVTQ